jgi:uncharacterized protein YaaN involved in tellurite resistance
MDMAQSDDLNLPIPMPDPGKLLPVAPKTASPEQLQSAETEAGELTRTVLQYPDDLQLLSRLTRIGDDAQRQAGRFFEMRRVTVSQLMNKISSGSDNPVPNQIKQMRAIMEKFDPRPFVEQIQLARQYGGSGIKNFLMRKIRGIPVIGELIRTIADQFRPISQEIDALLLAMDGGIVRLDENNAAVIAQSDELKRLIEAVALKAYAAELIFTRLKDQAASAPRDQNPRITHAMSRVGKRALFLRGNEQVFLQVLTGLRTSITTNLELRDTVAMMRDQAAPLLTNLYALIVVQQEARQIAEAAAATQEMVTDLLQTGAEMTRSNVEIIGQLSIKMVSEMENIIAAKETFLEAVARADQIAQQTVDAAASSIPVFQKASDELRAVIAQHEGADALNSK